MKKYISLLIALCYILTSITFCAYAQEASNSADDILDRLADSAHAELLDSDGNLIEVLDVDISLSEISRSRTAGNTYAVTYSSTTKSDSNSTYKNGVTATITIVWNDITGTTNSLVSVNYDWVTGSKELSDRYVNYYAYDLYGNVLDWDYAYPEDNDYQIVPINCTGFMFTAYSSAHIDDNNTTITLSASTSAAT